MGLNSKVTKAKNIDQLRKQNAVPKPRQLI